MAAPNLSIVRFAGRWRFHIRFLGALHPDELAGRIMA
jgi:hypothetical protein